jgi:hypothetical protein
MTARENTIDLSAIAFKVVAILEAYQLHIERLAADWRNRSLYRIVAAQLDQLRSLLGALPQLAVDMVEITLCHGQLLRVLQSQEARGDVSQLQVRQTDAVTSLHRKIVRLLSQPAGSR